MRQFAASPRRLDDSRRGDGLRQAAVHGRPARGQPVRREGRQPGRVLRPADVPPRRRPAGAAARQFADGDRSRSPDSRRCPSPSRPRSTYRADSSPRTPRAATAQFYAVDGEIQATPYQPVQPRTTSDVTQAGPGRSWRPAHGPHLGRPGDAESGDHDAHRRRDRCNPEAQRRRRLLPVCAAVDRSPSGRHRRPRSARRRARPVPRRPSSTTTGGGIQRLFTQTSAVVYYAPDGNSDVDSADITSTSAAIVGSSAAFTVRRHDNAGISRVNVLYSTPPANPSSPRTWSSVDLALAGSCTPAPVRALGRRPRSTTSCRSSTRVATCRSAPTRASTTADAPLVVLAARSDQQAAFDLACRRPAHPGSVHRRRTGHGHDHPSVGGPVNTRIDGGAPTSATSITVSAPGLHTVVSTGPDGSSATATFFIGTVVTPPTPPTATAHTATRRSAVGLVHVEPVGRDQQAWQARRPSPRSSTASDPRRSRSSTRPAPRCPSTCRAPRPSSTSAIDANGLEGAVGSLQVKFDSLPPQITLDDAGGRRHVHDRSGGQRRLQLRRCLRRLRPRCCQWLHGHQGPRSGDRHRNRRNQVVHRHHQGRCRKHDLDHAQPTRWSPASCRCRAAPSPRSPAVC